MAVVEYHDGNLMVMLPDGQIRSAESVKRATDIIKKWCRADLNVVAAHLGETVTGLCKVEWRGVAGDMLTGLPKAVESESAL